MENVVFTIVASNYLSLAENLGDSVTKYNTDVSFFIIIADDTTIQKRSKYSLTSVYDLGISESDLTDMAFKYNITEFCTSIKPFGFDYYANEHRAEKIIYFDPDVYLYNDVSHIFDQLAEDKLCLVTPHYFTPQVKYTGYTNEEMILFVGIFNFGFFAINAQHNSKTILIDWWKNRLQNKSYADKFDALHTDQKWMDFLPSYFGDKVVITHNLGWNLAFWNLHERLIVEKDDQLFVTNRISNDLILEPLMFIHFAGFDINDPTIIHKAYPFYLSAHPELKTVYDNYRSHLTKNEFNQNKSIPYKFSTFSNGEPIIKFHRRLYRVLNYKKDKFLNPFNVEEKNGFYLILKNNGLIVKKNIDKLNPNNYNKFDKKLHYLNKGMYWLKKIIGFNQYLLFSKFFIRYLRPENQTFLIKDHEYRYMNEEIKSGIYENEI